MLNTRQAYIRLDEILTEAPQRGDTLSLPAPKGHLRLENVFASAPGGQNAIIKGLSFDIPAGDAVGVIGPSAAGKSTLRSEEHTSELQSLMRISYAVFCLKKKNTNTTEHKYYTQI